MGANAGSNEESSSSFFTPLVCVVMIMIKFDEPLHLRGLTRRTVE